MTFDYSSSARNVSYGTYTGHFIDSAWVLLTVVLDTPEFSCWHTAVNICTAVQDVLQCCKVELGQLSGVVTDEVANMVAATRLLKTQEIAPHLYAVVCACHRLQTAIRHCMNLSSESRRLVGHFRHSDISSEALRQRQTQEGFGPH